MASVDLQNKRLPEVSICQDWGGNQPSRFQSSPHTGMSMQHRNPGLTPSSSLCLPAQTLDSAAGPQAPVVAGKAQKGAQFRNVGRPTPVGHSLDLLGIRRDSLARNDVTQVANLRLKERTLLKFRLQTFLLQLTKYHF